MTTVQRLNGGYDDPKRMLIIGLDPLPNGIDAGDYSMFSDPRRVKMPVSPFLVESVRAHGVNDPVTCVSVKASSGDRYRIVVNGRQRVRAAREAEIGLIPYVTLSDSDLTTVVVSNEGHTPQSPLDKAEKAQRMLDGGATKTEVMTSFRGEDGRSISDQTLANYLSLNKLTPAQKEALESGRLGVTEAYRLARGGLDSETIDTTGDEEGEGRPAREPSPRPSVKVLKALLALYEPTDTEPHEDEEAIIYAVLRWVVYGDTTSLPEECLELVRKVSQPKYRPAREEM